MLTNIMFMKQLLLLSTSIYIEQYNALNIQDMNIYCTCNAAIQYKYNQYNYYTVKYITTLYIMYVYTSAQHISAKIHTIWRTS